MKKAFDPIAMVEACYRNEADDVAWSRAVLEALAPASPGLGLYGFSVDLRGPELAWTPLADHGPVGDWRRSLAASQGNTPLEQNRIMYQVSPPVDTKLRRLRRMDPRIAEASNRLTLEPMGFATDTLGITAALHDGRQIVLCFTMHVGDSVAPRRMHQLTRVSAHVASAWRLRQLLGGSRLSAEPEAVLDPSGRLLDAAPAAQPAPARERLVDAVRRVERSRGRLRRSDPDEALEVWRGLVDGRWSLVDRVDRDGRRFVLARRNDPAAPDPKALDAGERDVVAHARLGHSNKYIAYLLGVAPTTVARRLESARRKLGARSRRELIELFAG